MHKIDADRKLGRAVRAGIYLAHRPGVKAQLDGHSGFLPNRFNLGATHTAPCTGNDPYLLESMPPSATRTPLLTTTADTAPSEPQIIRAFSEDVFPTLRQHSTTGRFQRGEPVNR